MSTNLAPMTAHTKDPMPEATARAAANAGMTVEAWITHTNKLAKGTKYLRGIDHEMRQTPRYRNAE